jgi:nucleotide-binding universal stress UspA family protein
MTTYRDILVHLDGGSHDAARVSAAAGLVRRFGGRLTGLFARVDHHSASIIARRPSELLNAAAEAAEQQFITLTSGIPARFWRLGHGDPGHVVGEMIVCARVSDLAVIGQHHPGKDVPADLAEQIILNSGRPCLIIPATGDFPVVGDNVMVAWNGGREATRAIHDAMPFLETANAVEVVTIRGDAAANGESRPPVSIIEHLGTHGIRVNREVLAAEDIGIMDLLLSRAFDQAADLLVMGAHGGPHLPFRKGIGSRYILEHMTLPVLMSH